MCLIVFAPNIETAVIRKSVLKRGFEGNSHGCGFAYVENGQLQLLKAFWTFESFYRAYLNVKNRIQRGPMLIHFRYATRGIHNKRNSQPIFINRNLVMAHNGTFHDLDFDNCNISDSVRLADNLGKMGMSFPLTRPYREILQALCGEYINKLVFLDNLGRWDIINPNLGSWRKGAWYSDKGECLKREFCPGYYASKIWKHTGEKKRELMFKYFPSEASRMYSSKYSNPVENDNDEFAYNFGYSEPKRYPTIRPETKTLFPAKRPFGGPSSYIKPLIIRSQPIGAF